MIGWQLIIELKGVVNWYAILDMMTFMDVMDGLHYDELKQFKLS